METLTDSRNLKTSITIADSVFIKLWLAINHSTLNRYFAFVVN